MTEHTIDKKTIRSVFWRSFALQGAFNYERMQNVGYAYAMIPVIRKLYDTEKERSAALQRHLTFFNSTPAVTTTIMGVSAAMEEQNAKNPETFDTSSINAVKASLMAPVAGIGDSLFWGTFRVIAAGVGVSLASDGNILGPILFMLLFNIPHLLVRYFGLRYGHKFGANSLERFAREGIMERVMAIANIVGMMVVGGMVATLLKVTTPIEFEMSEATVKIQDILDEIMPNMLPLAVTIGVFVLIRKRFPVAWITVGVLFAGVALHALKIL
jgi:fructoselysine and glucoselysine-specific PTS system IID component